MALGLGGMGLNPWDLYRYTMQEFVWKVKGFQSEKKEQWQRTRALAYITAKPNLKNQRTPIEKFWPMEGDKRTKPMIKDIKDAGQRRKAAEELYKWYVDNGHIKNN